MLKSALQFTKIVLLTWVLCPLVLSALAVFSTQAQAVSLKQNAVIDAETIKLADIFDDLPRNGERVLGAAPKPGQEMTLNSRTLLRIALALDLPWRPTSATEQITLKRASSSVSAEDVEAALRTALAGKNITGDYKIITESQNNGITLPRDVTPGVEVTALKLSSDNKHFEATLIAPSADKPLQTKKISGSLEKLVNVPVLRDALGIGSIIGKNDIEIKKIEEKLVDRNAVLKPDLLIGMTPRRTIAAGRTIATNDIEQPRMVARGDIVTMIFKEGALLLTAQGKALEAGVKGDQIRVVNASSNKTVDAIVSNSREVIIQSF